MAVFGDEDGVFAVATDGAVREHNCPVVTRFFTDVVVGFAETRHGFNADAITGF